MELHKHPIWVTVGILSGMTFLFNAGFIYSTINHDWIELKRYKQSIDHLEVKVTSLELKVIGLEKENKLIVRSIKSRDDYLLEIHHEIKNKIFIDNR